MRNNSGFLLTTLLMMAVLPAVAQQPAGGITDEKWIIEKDTKKIELPEADRNYEKITIEPPQTPAPQIQYQPEEIDLTVPKLTTKVGVVTIPKESNKKFYGNYVKAGIGNYATPYLEAFLSNKRNDSYSYGLHLKHYSSATGPVKYSPLSQNMVDGYFKRFGKKTEFTSRLSYSRDRYNFYGFNHEMPVDADTLKHRFSTIRFMAGLKNIDPDSKFTYDWSFNYYNFSDNLKARENEFLLGGSNGYTIDEEKSIISDVMLSVSSRKDSGTINRTFFQIKPAFVLNKEKYKVTAGFNVGYANDTISETKLHLYPRVEGDLFVIPDQLILYAGVTGEMQKNVLRTFVYKNPYLIPNVPLAHTNKTIDLYAGVRGNVKGVNYRGRVSYATYKYLYFFNNAFTDSSKFTILYDRGNTSVLNVEGDFSYALAETFRVGLNVNYFNYNTATLTQPWHRPKMVTTLSAGYNLYNKIFFNSEIYYISGLMGKNFISGLEYKLKPIVDLNLKVDYKFSNQFGAFLEINNILSRKYQRYLYYPVKGINVLGGVAYSF